MDDPAAVASPVRIGAAVTLVSRGVALADRVGESHRAWGSLARGSAVSVRIGTAVALVGCGVALINRLSMPHLDANVEVAEAVTVCVPARDEAERLPALIADLRAQTGVPALRVLILDDGSTDGTAAAAREAIAGDSRFEVIRSEVEPPAGWTGKAAACARLAGLVDAPIVVFLDADVRLAPQAIAAAGRALRDRGAALVSPWPTQVAGTFAEALVQPLLCWSWASTLPIVLGNRGHRPSTAVACGQFLAFDTAAYRAIGGHAAVADSPTEDLDIARVLRRAGHTAHLVIAGRLARTRMYRGATEIEAGYTRWLWSAYGGSRPAVAAVGTALALGYWLPPLAAVFGSGANRRTGALGYAAAVTGRLLARSLESGGPLHRADAIAALAHPLSIVAYQRLVLRSHRAKSHRALRWKGRALPAMD
ncbi:Glycosyltransferase like family 2 [Nocardia amikacinitolerans]|nr:Glycosyltransferase like family 2 [Nocardia amikacinitolerans]